MKISIPAGLLTLIICTIICVLAVGAAGKPNETAAFKDGCSQEKVNAADTLKDDEDSKAYTQKSDNDAAQWYAALKRPEWWLVGAAILTCIIIAWQAVETRRSAEAGRIAAEAALLNAQAVINAERARVIAELIPTSCRENKQWHREDGSVFNVEEIIRGEHLIYRLRILNLGRTPAHIFNYEVSFGPMVEGTEFSADQLQTKRFVNVNAFLASGEPKVLEDINMKDAFSHEAKTGAFCVTVKYGDLLTGKDEHRTFIMYHYRGSDSSLERITVGDEYT